MLLLLRSRYGIRYRRREKLRDFIFNMEHFGDAVCFCRIFADQQLLRAHWAGARVLGFVADGTSGGVGPRLIILGPHGGYMTFPESRTKTPSLGYYLGEGGSRGHQTAPKKKQSVSTQEKSNKCPYEVILYLHRSTSAQESGANELYILAAAPGGLVVEPCNY